EEATLVDLAAMVVSELELRLAAQQVAQVDAALIEITQGVAKVTGGEFFDELVKHFAKVLGADYVYIGLVEGTEPKMMKTIATCARGNIVENLEYRLEDTPCWEAIEQRKLCSYPRNVQAQFPNAPLLKPLAVESYIAIPFYGAGGNVLGLLGVMDGRPLTNVHLAESLLTIFASRIATELDRQQSELMLVEQTQLLEAIATGQSLDECLSAMCSSISLLSPHTRACVLLTDDRRTKFPRSITPDFPPSLSEGLKDAPISELAIAVADGKPFGTCGTAVYCGEPVTCPDIANDESWSQGWRDICIAHGIRACHSAPIMDVDRLPVGSVMLCFSEARLPTDWEYRLSEFGAKIASITIDRKRSIEKLAESEERLNLALTAADMVTWDADLSTGQIVLSANHSQILGYDLATADALTVEMCLRCIHPDDLAAVTQTWETARRERSLFCSEHRFVRADNGRVVWVAATGHFLENQAGSAKRFVGTIFDISERKQAEIALIESQQRLQSIVDAIPHAVWVLGADGEFHFNNQQWLNYYGMSFPEAMATQWSQLDPDEFAAIQQQWQLSLQTGMPYEAEFCWHFGGESKRWYLTRAEPIRDPSGQIVEWVGTNTDITNLKQVEAALQESQKFAQKLTEALPGAMYVYDIIEQRNIYANPQTLEMLGYTPEQLNALESEIAQIVVHPDDLASMMAYLEGFDTVQGGKVRELEYRARHTNGEWRWLLSRSTAFNRTPAGATQQILGVSIDITDRKVAELEIERLNHDLAAQTDELQTILDTLPVGVAIADDPQCSVIRTNRFGQKMLKVSADTNVSATGAEAETLPFRQYRDGREISGDQLPMQLATAQGQAIRDVEIQMLRSDGATFDWLVTAVPLFDEHHAVRGCVATFTDVTELKRLQSQLQLREAELTQYQARLAFVLNTTGVGLWLNSLPLGALNWDERTRELFFVPPDAEATIELFWSRVHPDDREPTRLAVEAALRDGTLYEIDHRAVNPDTGEIRWIKSAGKGTYTPDGEPISFDGINYDITERQVAAANLAQSNARFESAMLAVRGTVYEWNLQTKIIYRSRGLFDLLGFRSEDVPPTNEWWTERVHPDDLERTQAEFMAAPAGVDRFESEYRVRHAAGHWVYVSDRSYFQYDLQGELLKVVGFNTDITERKLAEEELYQSQLLVQRQLMEIEAIYQTAPIGLTILDRQLRYVRLNQRLAEINGIDIDDHIGRTMRDIVPTVADENEPILSGVIATGEPLLNLEISGETRAAPGVQRTWIQNCYPLRDETGQVAGINVVVQEITDRKRAEAELRESEERFRTLADNITQFTWMTDENGWIFWYNRRWFDYTGTTLEQMQGWGWQSVHHPEHIDRVVELFRHHLEIGQEWEDIFPLRGRDGQYRWFLSRAVPIRDESGRIIRWFGTNTDITELQQAEAALADRNKELTSFAYTVSHDLKAPLRAISNLSVWIEEDLEGQLPPDTQQQFDLLRTRVKRMELMIDSLLLYARAGRQEAQLETFHLAEFLSEIIDSIAPPEGFKIDIQPLLPTLTTKRVFLSQVFANLISNAIKHHNSVTGNIQISAIDRPTYHEFIIKDDGPGIAPENHAKVFEIFATLKVKDNSDSTGIGLAIVKKIIETEQGTIRLESSLGEGTTFYVTWPKSHQ
ncbi:PAS domain-containing protein, partial [Chamaesiphon polymorphus]